MELKPKKLDISNKDVEDTFAVNLIEKMEGNEEYQEKQNEIKNLKKKIKEEENQIEQTLEKNKEEIKKYVENIMKLQNNLINSQKGDIFYLEEENKIDEIKIQNLRATHRRLIEENKEEKDRINKIINEQIPIYTKELEKEIEEVKKMKHQLEIIGKKKPPNDIMKKIEVVMRYKKK
jgi:DNA repair exonuclease SbcCD ATPase subunit